MKDKVINNNLENFFSPISKFSIIAVSYADLISGAVK